ncbi:aminoglycoside phosphotransferase family protein [Jatrophihabitans fulvus]
MAQWVQRLPELVHRAATHWQLTLGPVFQPGGMTAWVAPGRTPHGTEVVLKVAWRHYEAEHEPDALKVWNGDGAIMLLDQLALGRQTGAMLLERCLPGAPLATRPPFEQDEVIATMLHRLWRVPPAGHPFRPLLQMCTDWLTAFDPDAATRLIGDPGIVRAGMATFAALAAEPGDPVLLATDLHAGNVLSAQRSPWLAIDPKPYVGDRHFDALQHLLNDPARLRTDLHGFVDRMAALLDLDRARLRSWLFARAVVEVRWFDVAVDVARELG